MKNKLLLLLPWAGLLLCSLTHAEPLINKSWKPVIGVGGGVGITPHVGVSQTFPIQNPITDEYYLYSPNRSTQTQGLFEVFLGTEHVAFQTWRLQAGLAYNQIGSYQAKGTFIQGVDAGSADQYTYHYSVTARELLAQAKLMHPCHDKFYPYVLVGLGGSFNQATAYSTNTPPFLAFTREYTNHTANSFAYKVGLGADVDITPHARIGVAYRFSGLGHAALGSARIDSTAVSGTLSQSNLYANEVLIQLTYII